MLRYLKSSTVKVYCYVRPKTIDWWFGTLVLVKPGGSNQDYIVTVTPLGGVLSHWVLSVVREEKLSLLLEKSVHYKPLEMKIWVTNTKADDEARDLSWSVFLVVDFT
ncbi:unnamed protein product, partial [Brassica oleracea]